MKTWIEDNKKIVSYTLEELKAMRAEKKRQGTWTPPPSMSDAEIDVSIAADPDSTLLTDKELAQPPKWGGARSGSGRPKGSTRPPKGEKRIPLTVQILPEFVQWLRDAPGSQASLVEQALAGHFKIKSNSDSANFT